MTDQPSTVTDHRPVVIVTGGSGLVGSSVIERLLGDYRVVSFDVEGDPKSPAEVEFICCDLTDPESIGRALDRVRKLFGDHIASVVHLAAYYDFAGRDSPLYEKITIGGTLNLVRALRDFHVDQFLFSSTMLVHEPVDPGEEIDETDPLEPTWPYPQSKLETEALLRDPGSPPAGSVVVARLAGVYDENGNSPPITNQIKRIDGRWPTSHFYPAEGNRGQAFVHLDDAVTALTRIVDRRDELPAWFPVLIGEPRTVGYDELQDTIARELHGQDWRTFRVPAPIAKLGAWLREQNPFGDDPFIRSWMVDRAGDHYDLDIGVAREQLGWNPQHNVVDTIPEMVERLRADRDSWYANNNLTPPRRSLAA